MAPRRPRPATTDDSPATPATPTETATDESASSTPDSTLPAVVAAEPTDLEPYEGPDDGFGEAVTFAPTELRINRAKGEFWLDGDEEPRRELILIPRGCHKAQMFYGLAYDPKVKHEPSCQSPDGRIAEGWIDPNTMEEAMRKCLACPKKGFGAGSCTDLMRLLAWDVERKLPVRLTFQNAELNPRKGAFILAVNRFRSMGLKPQETVMRVGFKDTEAAYKALTFEVIAAAGAQDQESLLQIQQTLDICWSAYESSRAIALEDMHSLYAEQEAIAA